MVYARGRPGRGSATVEGESASKETSQGDLCTGILILLKMREVFGLLYAVNSGSCSSKLTQKSPQTTDFLRLNRTQSTKALLFIAKEVFQV